MERLNVKRMGRAALAAELAALGEARHRCDQIMQWIWNKGAGSFDEMTNLPLGLRRLLAGRLRIPRLEIAGSVSSAADGSQKFLLAGEDGALIETVLMQMENHFTVCVSSQAGCPLACAFCRTGSGAFVRNLEVDEILDQILIVRAGLIPPRRRYNVVFMGMGEPLLNIEGLRAALGILNDQSAFGLREKRITVSTIGIPAGIRELGRTSLAFGLAVSLNAADDDLRRRLMPAAAGIAETLAAAEEFAAARRMRATLVYVVIGGVNDTPEQARRLAAITRGRPFKINLIPFNPWPGCRLRRPGERELERFIRILLPAAPAVTVRRSQGADISAACGQLRADRTEYGS